MQTETILLTPSCRMYTDMARMMGGESALAHEGLGLDQGLQGLPCPSSLLLGVFVTLLPKVLTMSMMVTMLTPSPQMVPRLMPFFLASNPEAKERFSDADYLLESEDMFR